MDIVDQYDTENHDTSEYMQLYYIKDILRLYIDNVEESKKTNSDTNKDMFIAQTIINEINKKLRY